MIMNFDKLRRAEAPCLSLCNPGSTAASEPETGGVRLTGCLGMLEAVSDLKFSFHFNAPSEMSFTYTKITAQETARDLHNSRMFEAIQVNRLIYADDIGYFVITGVESKCTDRIWTKSISASSAECELDRIALPYIPDGVYTAAQIFSMLFTPGSSGEFAATPWGIGYAIDPALSEIRRSFENIEEQSVYAFLMEQVQEAYACIIDYDIQKRVIDVRSQAAYAERMQTSIHLSRQNFIRELRMEEGTDKLYTALRVSGGNDLTIHSVNPLGTDVIYQFTPYLSWMSAPLRAAVTQWKAAYDAILPSYAEKNEALTAAETELSAKQQTLTLYQQRLQIYRSCQDNVLSHGLTEEKVNAYNEALGSAEITAEETLAAIRQKISACEASIAAQRAAVETYTDQTYQPLLSEIAQMQASVKFSAFLDADLLTELSAFLFQADYSDEYITVTDSMTYAETYAQAKALYDRAALQLKNLSQQSRKFTVDTESFIFAEKFKAFTAQLAGGAIISVETEDDCCEQLHLTAFDVDFEAGTLSLTFGNKYNKYDIKSLFNDVLGNVKKSASSLKYVRDALAGARQEVSSVQDWIREALTLTKDKALSSENQEVLIDSGGYLGRQLAGTDLSGNPLYSNEQLRLVHNEIVMTDDNWNTAKAAFGKILFGYDDRGEPVYKYGVIGDAIVGKLIAGESVIIQAEGADGAVHTTIDENGLSIYNGNFTIYDRPAADPNRQKILSCQQQEDGTYQLSLRMRSGKTIEESLSEIGKAVKIMGDSGFKYAADGSVSPSVLTLTAEVSGAAFFRGWQYWNGTAWIDLSSDNPVQISPDAAYWTHARAVLRAVTNEDAVYDMITLYKVYDGQKGDSGADGIVPVYDTAPSDPEDGDCYVNSATGAMYLYKKPLEGNGEWIQLYDAEITKVRQDVQERVLISQYETGLEETKNSIRTWAEETLEMKGANDSILQQMRTDIDQNAQDITLKAETLSAVENQTKDISEKLAKYFIFGTDGLRIKSEQNEVQSPYSTLYDHHSMSILYNDTPISRTDSEGTEVPQLFSRDLFGIGSWQIKPNGNHLICEYVNRSYKIGEVTA